MRAARRLGPRSLRAPRAAATPLIRCLCYLYAFLGDIVFVLFVCSRRYDKYLRDHGESLRAQPVPRIARKYYEEDNPFLFDLFCTVQEDNAPGGLGSGADGSGGGGGAGAHAGLSGLAASGCARERRPLETLYDVFVNVRDDEREHWKTLCNLVQFDDMQGTGAPVQSTRPLPSSEVTAQT